jgi:CheY-like chemotaxis protein
LILFHAINTMTSPCPARILVASDNADDARQIVDELAVEFRNVEAASHPGTAVADFDAFLPDVLVLAFERLEKAQAYELGLYRMSRKVPQHVHRTVLLCEKNSVATAFELCRKGLFDDYVLYWPHAHDGHRLVMSVFNVARQSLESKASGPSHLQLLSHLKQIDEMRTLVHDQLTEGEKQVAVIEQSVNEARDAVGAAIEEVSERLAGSNVLGILDAQDRTRLSGELDRLKNEPVSQAFGATKAAITPARAWSTQLKDKLMPYITGLSALRETINHTPRILIVDDNDLDRKLIAKALDGEDYELELAGDGRSALALLRRGVPDLILMDVNLPDISGVSLTLRLKTLPHLARVPVLMLTSESRLHVLEQSVKAGAVGFIVKPFSKASMLAKLERFLRDSR